MSDPRPPDEHADENTDGHLAMLLRDATYGAEPTADGWRDVVDASLRMRAAAGRTSRIGYLAVAAAAVILVLVAALTLTRGDDHSDIATTPAPPPGALPVPLAGFDTGMTLLTVDPLPATPDELEKIGRPRSVTAVDLDTGVARRVPVDVGSDLAGFGVLPDGAVAVAPTGWGREGYTWYRLGPGLSVDNLRSQLVTDKETSANPTSQAGAYVAGSGEAEDFVPGCAPAVPLESGAIIGRLWVNLVGDASGCDLVQLTDPDDRTSRTLKLDATWTADDVSDRSLLSSSLDGSKIVVFDLAGRSRVVDPTSGSVTITDPTPGALTERLRNGVSTDTLEGMVPSGPEGFTPIATWSPDSRLFSLFAPGATDGMDELGGVQVPGMSIAPTPPLLFILDTRAGRWAQVQLPLGATASFAALIPTESLPAIDPGGLDLCPTQTSDLTSGEPQIVVSRPCRLPAP